jgi:hypothetical protein
MFGAGTLRCAKGTLGGLGGMTAGAIGCSVVFGRRLLVTWIHGAVLSSGMMCWIGPSCSFGRGSGSGVTAGAVVVLGCAMGAVGAGATSCVVVLVVRCWCICDN